MRRFIQKYAAMCCLAGALSLGGSQSTYAQDSQEYLVKAAFIYNFLKFVEWPGAAAIDKQSSIDICVLGDSGMLAAKDVFVKGSSPALRINLVEENNVRDVAKHCHIVFIGASEASSISSTLFVLKDAPVLTVSDISNFAERGGMIGFTVSDKKIRLVVNAESVATAGLRIDAQLLEIALKVIGR